MNEDHKIPLRGYRPVALDPLSHPSQGAKCTLKMFNVEGLLSDHTHNPPCDQRHKTIYETACLSWE